MIDGIYIIVLFALMLLNIGLGVISKGFVLSGVVGILTFAIVAYTFTDPAVYAQIVFAPYMQIMVLFVALICMANNARSSFS